MNQNGDPSQAWIKVKPDGRVDVFAGTSDIGNGSKTIQSQIVAETIGVPYDWITYDNSNTDSSPVCTGTFASRATFVAGKAVEKAAESVAAKILEIAGKELEIDPADLEIVDGEVIAKGAPQKKIGVPDVAAAATWGHGELITGTGAQLKPYATIVEPETGKVDLPPHSAISYAVVRGRGRGRRRDGRRHASRGCGSATTSAGRSTRRSSRARSRAAPCRASGSACSRTATRTTRRSSTAAAQFGSYLAPGMEDLPQIDTIIIENPSSGRPVRREGDRRDGEQRPAAGDRGGGVRRRRRVGDRAADHARAGAARARRRRQRAAASRRATARRWSTTSELSVNTVGSGITFGAAA